jgi:hypothetical protein
VADTPRADAALYQELSGVQGRLHELLVELHGDRLMASRNEPVPDGIVARVNQVVNAWGSTSEPTATHRRNYEIAAAQLASFLPRLERLAADLAALERRAEELGAPWTPGRLPSWRPQ